MINTIRFSKTAFFKFLFFSSLMLVLISTRLLAGNASPAENARYRVFSLRHLPAERGKAVLEQLGIGTISHLPNSNTLLITASGKDLIKASSILHLIDSEKKYVIEIIGSVSEVGKLSSNEDLEKYLGSEVSVGTFENPPSPLVDESIIIDIHNDTVLAFVRDGFSENLFNAIDQLKQKGKPPAEVSEPNISPVIVKEELNDTNDEFFNGLLQSLEEAEQKAAELKLATESPDEVKSKIAALHQEKTIHIQPKASSEQAASYTPDLESLQQMLLPAGEPVKPSKSLSEGITKSTEDKIQAKSGEIPIREPKPKKRVKHLRIDENVYRPDIPTTKDELRINLPSKLNIIDLLTLVGEYLELDFMYDPKKVKGEVMLNFRGPILVKDLYPLMESVLKFNNFVMTRKESLVTIVPLNEALTYDPEIYLEPGKVKVGDVIITRIFELQHIDTTSAKNLLDRLKLGASIEEIKATKTLIVTEYAYRMPRIEELINLVDQPGEPKKFRYRRLEYTLAQSLVKQVKDLADKLGTVSITIGAETKKPQAPQQPARRVRTPTPRQAAAEPEIDLSETVERGVYLVSDERTNRILMIGLDQDLEVVEDIITALDVEKEDLRMLRLYEIQNVGAGDAAGKLYDLGIISVMPSSTRTRTRTGTARTGRISTAPRQATQQRGAAQQQPQTTDAASVEEILTGEPQVVTIESTNSLLVNATAEQHAQIALIIGYVDSETERAAIPYVVYPLENQDPTELSQILTQLITETTQMQDQEGKIVSSTTTKLLEDDIVIIPDPATYSLIVYASRKNQQWISSIIKQLDEYRPQVLLDVTLVEITKSDKFDYELNLIQAFPDLTETSGQINPIADLSGVQRDRFIEYQSNNGSGIGFYADAHINALLKAVQAKNYGRILARPKILVNDNQDGTIKAQNQEFVAQTQTNVVPTGSGTSTTQTSVNFQSYTAGIELTIKPHISKGQQLQLDITLDRTDFSGESKKINVSGDELEVPRDTITSNVKTIITVPDGKTIILGGLEKLKQSKGGNKVPLLGDLPIVGGLFRGIHNSDEQDRLYVFVKAHILRPGEQIEGESDIIKISNKNRATFEKYEKEMQEYQDWPGIKSKPFDPISVLEQD